MGNWLAGEKLWGRCYNEKRYKVTNHLNIEAELFAKVNHSLEYDNYPVESIDVLKTIINDMNQF